jgi:predicted transcriptional regulator
MVPFRQISQRAKDPPRTGIAGEELVILGLSNQDRSPRENGPAPNNGLTNTLKSRGLFAVSKCLTVTLELSSNGIAAMQLDDDHTPTPLVAITAGIVAAYVQNHVVHASGVGELISSVHAALNNTTKVSSITVQRLEEKPKPAISIRKSITDEFLVCLEDGKQYKSLKRHLSSKFGMTPQAYRAKWGLPDDYPMVAPAYAAKRAQLARNHGLGRLRRTAT